MTAFVDEKTEKEDKADQGCRRRKSETWEK